MKLKVVEVLSLHCLDREPREGFAHNRWVAEVVVEAMPLYSRPLYTLKRTVTLKAKDYLEAYTKLLTEGA